MQQHIIIAARGSRVGPRHQHGAVLILSMVILLIMTLIGTANMQSSGFQQKMASNTKARQEAFEVAESTLRFAEDVFVRSYNPNKSEQILIFNCSDGDSTCFESTCAGGLCFDGMLDNTSRPACQVRDSTAYLDKNVWDQDAKHMKAVGLLGGRQSDYLSEPKYVIEFLCYVKKSNTLLCDTNNSCAPYFRITTLVERRGVASRVMLSSTFRVTD